ncbi:GntR family transcriptional regulator [Hyunsoonleella sp. SJ7]|uniref:GntR family transcriptional regulator n=1 Tax=Hyunsoonleella aquatilis TaxID=2762758 RepID=A0A923HEE7_9FLAO|nr:GntR family transcriptional regulator [Hyunsoonleella aquatilis]MBC3757905.1 GntR family transcriptional regulator [Hyunsoonleella aquatilis]
MEFKATKGIYLQIADSICNQILEGKLQPNERVPSVRDLAAELEVNRNTVMRTYSYLEGEEIFNNKRGVGFFVAEHAVKLIKNRNKKEFFKNELPILLEKIKLLQLDSNDLKALIDELKQNDPNENK